VGGTNTLTASGANSYIWSTTQTGNSIVITPVLTTTYVVNGSSHGCSAITNFIQNIDTACFAGIKQISNIDNQINIYPNPATNGSFAVLINENSGSANIVVLNSLGQKVFETKTTGQNTQIALPNYSSGIYYVQINNRSNGNGSSVKKVIVN
jgi:hypothetical protein